MTVLELMTEVVWIKAATGRVELDHEGAVIYLGQAAHRLTTRQLHENGPGIVREAFEWLKHRAA